MRERIELFKMITTRNELCRVNWNTLQKYNYWANWTKRSNDRQLKELNYSRSCAINDESIKSIDEAIAKRKENIGFIDRSPNFMKELLLEYTNANDAVYKFTKETRKRRMELQRLFQTKQKKNCINMIEYIRIDGEFYTADQMKAEIVNHDIEQILLGNENPEA